MAALNVREADEYPRATQEVPKIIELISGLIDSGHAYESNGDVYFRVRSDEQYGKLSHRSLDAMRAGARIETGRAEGAPDGLRALEVRQARRAVVGQPVGRRTPRLAHRVLRDGAALSR